MSKEDFYKKHYDLFDKLIQASFEKAKKLVDETSWKHKDWKFAEEKNDCKLFKKSVDYSKYDIVQGVQIVNSKRNVRDILQFVNDISIRDEHKKLFGKCDPFVYYNAVHRRTHNQVLVHCRFTTDRDFVIVRDVIHQDISSYMFGMSIPEEVMKNDGWPKDAKCVRGEVILFSWKVQRIDDEKVRIQYFTHTNPGGWIPSSVYNATCASSAYACQRYCDNLKDYFAGK